MVVLAPVADTLPSQPRALEMLYGQPSTALELRHTIIVRLGALQTREGAESLGRLFDRERRMDEKMQILQVMADLLSEECRTSRDRIVERALAPTQAVDVRMAAMQMLVNSGAPGIDERLQKLTRDAQAAIRDNARRLLAERVH